MKLTFRHMNVHREVEEIVLKDIPPFEAVQFIQANYVICDAIRRKVTMSHSCSPDELTNEYRIRFQDQKGVFIEDVFLVEFDEGLGGWEHKSFQRALSKTGLPIKSRYD